jgi:hypothetical protein
MRRSTAACAGILMMTASPVVPAGAEPGAGLPGLSPIGGDPQRRLLEEAARAVRVRLVSETAELSAGKPGMIGLSFDIADKWHLYWRNAGDTGLPIAWTFTAPAGVKIGAAQWPAPSRKVSPGEILDYVYEDRVTILFPVVVSPSQTGASGEVTIRADVDWLVCREACVPGSRSVELVLRVGGEGGPSADAGLFAEARVRLALPPAERPAPVFRASLVGGVLRVECEGAERLAFFPHEGGAQPLDPLRECVAEGPVLTARYGGLSAGKPVRGVLEVVRGRSRSFHLVEASPEASPAE